MNTEDLVAFTTIVAAGSLAGAARRLNLTPMAVSRRLAALEAALGVRLLHRTTRSLSLTADGETFLPHALALVDGEREAMSRLRADARGAGGLLRVTASVAFGRKIIAPMVPALLLANPELRVALDMTDSQPDLVASGTDLAIRIARLRDSDLVAQKLADNPRRLVASPDYLARRGRPDRLDALADHDCLPMGDGRHWTFELADGGRQDVRVDGRFRASSVEGCQAACLAGGGIANLSEWNVADDIAAGRLLCLDIAGARPEELAIWAVYPSRRLLPQRVRVFIAELRRTLSAHRFPGATA